MVRISSELVFEDRETRGPWAFASLSKNIVDEL